MIAIHIQTPTKNAAKATPKTTANNIVKKY